MRTLMLAGMVLACAMTAAAAQDELVIKSTGGKLVGVISNMTDTAVTIVTSTGVLTYPWDALDEKTLKRYNPEKYQALLDERRKAFEAKKLKQGLVPYKGKWMTVKQKTEAEMKDKGYALYEGKWLPTNDVEKLIFKKKMEAAGRKEYKGKWYTAGELEDVMTTDKNRGLKPGMSETEVKAKWGEPAEKRESPDFKARKRVCWIYPRKEQKTEDRVIFEMGLVKEVAVDQEVSGDEGE